MTQLQRSAGRHLWRHFAAPGLERELSIFVRGEGCYVWDERGRRHLDALSSLFCVNIGHGRDELGQAAAAQARAGLCDHLGHRAPAGDRARRARRGFGPGGS